MHTVCTVALHVTGSSTLETSSGGEWNHKVRVWHNAQDIKSCCCGAPSNKLYMLMTAVADTRSLRGITVSRFLNFQFHCNTQMFSEITITTPDISTNSKNPPEQKPMGRKSRLIRRKGDVYRTCTHKRHLPPLPLPLTADNQNFANQLSRNGSSITGNRDVLC